MSSRRFLIIGCTTLLVVTFAVYVGVLWNDFLEFDDNIYVFRNMQTAAGLTLDGFRYAWTTFDSGNWIPLTWLSFQLDATLFGMNPVGFHATNVVLHVANVLLLFTWLFHVTGARWRSFVVAGIFGLHPLHVESVAWIAERKDVLSTFWLLISLHAYERYAIRPAVSWYLTTCFTFLLGLLSKSMVVTFPLLLILVDVWPLQRWRALKSPTGTAFRYPQRSVGRLILEKLPFLGLSFLDGVVTLRVQAWATAFNQTNGDSPIQRLESVIHNYGWYLAKTFNPTELMAFYPRPLTGLPLSQVAASAVLLSGISAYVAVNRIRRPYLAFGWLWYLISLLPVIGLLQVGLQAHADRYTYVPHIGLLVSIVWEGHSWVSRLPATRQMTVATLTIIALALSWLTICQVMVWRTTKSLWEHAVSIDPENTFAHGALAICQLESNELDEASKHFEFFLKRNAEKKEAIDRLVNIYRKYSARPQDKSQLRTELGIFYANQKSMLMARDLFKQAVSLSPKNNSARYNLALAFADLNHPQEAIFQLEEVLKQDPNDANAHVTLGLLLEKVGRLSAAREHFLAALKYYPADQGLRAKLTEQNQRLELPLSSNFK